MKLFIIDDAQLDDLDICIIGAVVGAIVAAGGVAVVIVIAVVVIINITIGGRGMALSCYY